MTTAVLRSAQAGAILTSALSRLTRILLLVAVALCLGAPAAGAVPAKKLDNNLAAMWTTILQTPRRREPLRSTDGCIHLGGTLAPFGPDGVKGVHGKTRHQNIHRGDLIRVQHGAGRWAGEDATEEALRACLDNPPPDTW